MRARPVAFLLAVVLVFYLFIAMAYGVAFLSAGTPVGIGLGFAVLILPLIGVWVLVRELQFGRAVERMGRELDPQVAAAIERFLADVDSDHSDRRETADAEFERVRRDLADQGGGDSWADWYRLAVIYDQAGDRSRARECMRHARQIYNAAP